MQNMKTLLLGITTALLLFTGCNKDAATSASEAAASDENIESASLLIDGRWTVEACVQYVP